MLQSGKHTFKTSLNVLMVWPKQLLVFAAFIFIMSLDFLLITQLLKNFVAVVIASANPRPIRIIVIIQASKLLGIITHYDLKGFPSVPSVP